MPSAKKHTYPYDDPGCKMGPKAIRNLYRVLRPEEDPRVGLMPKDLTSTKTHELHVSHGSRTKTRFISTTKDPRVAERWLCKAGAPDSKIVRIKVDEPLRQRLIDVSCGQNLNGVMAKNFANSSKEVIVDGSIPAKNITVLRDSRPDSGQCEENETRWQQAVKDAKKQRTGLGNMPVTRRKPVCRHNISMQALRDKAETQHGGAIFAAPLAALAAGAAPIAKTVAITYGFTVALRTLLQAVQVLQNMPEEDQVLYLKAYLQHFFTRDNLLSKPFQSMLSTYIIGKVTGLQASTIKRAVGEAAL